MFKIKNIHARQIMDSRGNPTIECDVFLNSGVMGRASVPSGASTGTHEVLELRDGGLDYMGKGVSKAIKNVNKIIAPAIIKMDSREQSKIDKKMIDLDGTFNKSKLGANAILAVSIATAHAAARQSGKSLYAYLGTGKLLPRPMINVINGGAHADNSLDVQEFMIIPLAKSEAQSIKISGEIFHNLKSILKKSGYSTNVGDEGGFAPNIKNTRGALNIITQAIKVAGYKPGKDVALGLDIAASEFYKNGVYGFENKKLSSNQMIKFYEDLLKDYPIISIEDGLAEDDWDGWKELTKRLGKKIQLVGDDLFVTNPVRLKRGIDNKIANTILIKPNQIGTITETLETIKIAKKAGYGVIISHRSGETEDTTIADLAVAINAGQIKTGSMSRTERMAKYNQLIRIEEELGIKSKY